MKTFHNREAERASRFLRRYVAVRVRLEFKQEIPSRTGKTSYFSFRVFSRLADPEDLLVFRGEGGEWRVR